jgi:hypothetical protein
MRPVLTRAVNPNGCAEFTIGFHQHRTIGDSGRPPVVVDRTTPYARKRDGAAAVRIASPYATHAEVHPAIRSTGADGLAFGLTGWDGTGYA